MAMRRLLLLVAEVVVVVEQLAIAVLIKQVRQVEDLVALLRLLVSTEWVVAVVVPQLLAEIAVGVVEVVGPVAQQQVLLVAAVFEVEAPVVVVPAAPHLVLVVLEAPVATCREQQLEVVVLLVLLRVVQVEMAQIIPPA